MTDNWQLLDSENLFSDEWVTVRRKHYRAPVATSTQSFVVLERSDFVVVAAVDSLSRILLVRQYRPGTDRHYWALPAGYVNANELPIEAARRELLEETGVAAGQTTAVGELHPLPGYVRSAAHAFLCEELQSDLTAERDLEIEKADAVPLEIAIDRIVAGDICEMQAVATILLVREIMRRRLKLTSSGDPGPN